MQFLQELFEQDIIDARVEPKLYCKVFEDNEGALEMATTPKMRPRTKYLNTKYHHFRDAVRRGILKIFSIDTLEQQADIFTKPLSVDLFEKFRRLIMGW